MINLKKRMKEGISLMAFGAGKQSVDIERKLYIGLGVFRIIAVNPTREEKLQLLGYAPEEEIVYHGVDKDTQVPQVRISFVLETIPEKNNGIEWRTEVSIYLRNQKSVSKAGKIQVLDNYGNSQWLEPEVVSSGIAPVGSKLFGEFEPALAGMATLIDILKAYINIPEIMTYNNTTREWYKNPSNDPMECEAKLDEVSKYFSGQVNELRNIIGYQPNNSFKLLVGVKNTDTGRLYQDFYTQTPMRLNSNSTSSLEKNLAADAVAGRHSNTTYEVCELKEYTVKPTDTSSPEAASTPWATVSPF